MVLADSLPFPFFFPRNPLVFRGSRVLAAQDVFPLFCSRLFFSFPPLFPREGLFLLLFTSLRSSAERYKGGPFFFCEVSFFPFPSSFPLPKAVSSGDQFADYGFPTFPCGFFSPFFFSFSDKETF